MRASVLVSFKATVVSPFTLGLEGCSLSDSTITSGEGGLLSDFMSLCEVRMSTGPSPTSPSPLPIATAVTSAALSNPWAGPAPGSGVTLMSPSVFKSEANNPLSIFIFLLSTSSSVGSRSSARF